MTNIDIEPKVLLPEEPVAFSVSGYLTDRLNRFQLTPETLVFVVALVIGVSSGLVVIFFRYLIELCQAISYEKLLGIISVWGGWTLLLIPALGGLIVGMMKWLFPQVLGQDFYSLISNTREQKIAPWRPALKMVAAAISLGTGASLGPESPSVEIGSNIGMILAQLFQVSKERYRLLLGAGAAAGLAAGFNAPIAGVFFALEVVLGTAFTTPAASLILLSAFNSAAIASSILGIHPALKLPVYQVVSYWEWFFYLGLGLLASLVAFIYTQSIKLAQASFRGEIKALSWLSYLPIWTKPVIGGLILGMIALKLPQVLGVDYGTVEQILTGDKFSLSLLGWLLLVKLFATAISLGSGLVGGVFAPAMFLGACLGASYGNILAMVIPPELAIAPPPAYAIVGMAAVLAASVNAPLTAIALLFELTQSYSIILPLMAAVGVSVWIIGLIQSKRATDGLNLQQMGMNLEKQDERELLGQISVAEMMSDSYLALPNSLSVIEAGKKILRNKCHTALVFDQQQQLVGIVTLTDIKRNLVEVEQQILERSLLQDICTSEVLFAYPEDSISFVLERMGTRGLYLLPVVNPDDPRQVLGIISKDQIYVAEDLIATQVALNSYLSLKAVV
ncbi:chloride channel protein [Chondrocystis sp. NIES-4102]|nr:chloride channel protein [Chondrocystis sp. NIES-4102]